MLTAPSIPGLLITATDTGVGKTVVTGAIAAHLREQGVRVGVFKPVGSGCVRRREGLVSEDAEFLAHCADAPHPLDIICPQRYAEPLAPAVAAQRARQPVDWSIVDRALAAIVRDSDVILVEGIGGIMVPMDERHTMLDVATWLGLPAIVVARPALGTINHTILALGALRGANVKTAGVVVNRYPSETPGVAEETNPRAIERWGKTSVLCIVPDTSEPIGLTLPRDITTAIATVDWQHVMRGRTRARKQSD